MKKTSSFILLFALTILCQANETNLAKKTITNFNGAFKISSGNTFPDDWRELKKPTEQNALICQNNIMDFGKKDIDLKRYRYLLSKKKFPCQEGDKIIVTYYAKGKGLFAPGVYFYYNEKTGRSFLEHKRTKLDSPNTFTKMETTFVPKNREGKIPSQIMPMFYAFPNSTLELKDISISIEPKSKAKTKTSQVPEQQAKTININGNFNISAGKTFPDTWKELKAKNQASSLSCKNGIMDFGSKKEDLLKYRYLLQEKRFSCKDGDTITVTYSVKGKGLFAPGMYFYYNNKLGKYFLEHKRTNLNSPDKFTEMKIVFTVKNRQDKNPEKFVPMFYAFPNTKLQIKNVMVKITEK